VEQAWVLPHTRSSKPALFLFSFVYHPVNCASKGNSEAPGEKDRLASARTRTVQEWGIVANQEGDLRIGCAPQKFGTANIHDRKAA
jgi:hypothetical protein